MPAAPSAGVAPAYRRYLFRYCVQAACLTTVPAQVWRSSLDDRLTEYGTGVDLDGYVWGVKWQALYPGASGVPQSGTATRCAQELGIEFHEVRIQTNAQDLTLVFSDLQVSEPLAGYTPFRVPEG